MASILGTGNATLDIILSMDEYPAEDAEIRALDRRMCRGGNTANTLVVLSMLGHRCVWAGILSDDTGGFFIRDDLMSHQVELHPGRTVRNGVVPTSYVMLNRRNGSRTIVHYRNLPEFTIQDFERVDPEKYDWLHFEGRNIEETRRMLSRVRCHNPHIPVSLEIEKNRPGISGLFTYADVLLFSRQYAVEQGFREPLDFLRSVKAECAAADLYCTWSGEGAAALTRGGEACRVPAWSPQKVVDTLGAGDTFNAAVIDGYLKNQDIGTILRAASELAGRKCGQQGFDGLT